MDCDQLEELRRRIDGVDGELLELLNRRAGLSLEVGRFKQATGVASVFDPRRESDLLDGLVRRNPGPLPETHLRTIWREILSSSKALQRPPRAAYLGPEGTFSFFAGLEYLGRSTQFEPCADLTEVFQKVYDGSCSLGVVPLENSLHGTVGAGFDLFLRYDVEIRAEFVSRISHCLLSNAASLPEIRTVYSHPQPLGQCGNWLRSHLPTAVLVPVESTAAAAYRAAAEKGAAAVGHRRLADMAGLDLRATSIEDAPGNRTRFVIIALRNDETPALPRAANTEPHAVKTSVLFTLPDKPGALSSVLSLPAEAGVNLLKLESRPMAGRCWKYVFFADMECDLTESSHAPLIHRLGEACTTFRILGSYPAASDICSAPEARR